MTGLRLAACASSEAALERLVQALGAAGRFDILAVRSPKDLPARAESIALTVLAAEALGASTVESYMLQLQGRAPLLVVGGEPPSLAGISMWLPALPSRTALRSIVELLVAAPPSTEPRKAPPAEEARGLSGWRRKTDIIVGESASTRRLLHDLERLAPSNALVLVTGETGTGKELVARALHHCGPRAREPFVAINCAALPESLVEAELFGYARGAFTGAAVARPGAFESAQGGTLFLDEIGEMPRSVQPKLLRVLETYELTRLGSTEPRPVKARLVVATNRDLLSEVNLGTFREDLYYRLNVYPLHLPPLRERSEDIPMLVGHHLRILAAREQRPAPRLTAAALERLAAHRWPGNVRELVHVLTRAMILSTEGIIDTEHIELPEASGDAPVVRYRDAKQAFEREYFVRLLSVANGNVARAARMAGKTRKEIYDGLKRVGVDVAPYRRGVDLDG